MARHSSLLSYYFFLSKRWTCGVLYFPTFCVRSSVRATFAAVFAGCPFLFAGITLSFCGNEKKMAFSFVYRLRRRRRFFRVHCLHGSNQQTIKILMNNASEHNLFKIWFTAVDVFRVTRQQLCSIHFLRGVCAREEPNRVRAHFRPRYTASAYPISVISVYIILMKMINCYTATNSIPESSHTDFPLGERWTTMFWLISADGQCKARRNKRPHYDHGTHFKFIRI